MIFQGSYNNQPTPKSPLSRDADTSHDFAETSTIYSEKGKKLLNNGENLL